MVAQGLNLPSNLRQEAFWGELRAHLGHRLTCD